MTTARKTYSHYASHVTAASHTKTASQGNDRDRRFVVNKPSIPVTCITVAMAYKALKEGIPEHEIQRLYGYNNKQMECLKEFAR